MKSSGKQLAGRGYAHQAALDAAGALPTAALFAQVSAPDAEIRTAAIMTLATRGDVDKASFIDVLLEQLSKETKLYTKMAICTALENGGSTAATKMAAFLGKIGRNQHMVVPESISRKKSYPLPRDIIARSMARMYPDAAGTLVGGLKGCEDETILSEALDAFGFMAFYHPALQTAENCALICALLSHNSIKDLLVWKCTLCLSAFPHEEGLLLLSHIGREHPHATIRAEALRSLSRAGR